MTCRILDHATLVKRGQALFDIYSPELVSAQEEYVVARENAGADSALVESARTRLELWGLPARVIGPRRCRWPLSRF